MVLCGKSAGLGGGHSGKVCEWRLPLGDANELVRVGGANSLKSFEKNKGRERGAKKGEIRQLFPGVI